MSIARDQLTPFARLLKFWRTTLGYSQEALSAAVGVSTRHLSFLETARSSPSRAIIIDLATEFKLSGRDTNHLLVAANFVPVDSVLMPHLENENAYQGKLMEYSLKSVQTTPACISDATGNLLMVNRATLYFQDYWQTGFMSRNCENAYELMISDQGLRPHLQHWEDVASALLMTLQQEILLTDDAATQAILDNLLKLPQLPKDWRQIGAKVPPNHSFTLQLLHPQDGHQTYVVTNNTIGATPFVCEPRRILTCLNPVEGVPAVDRARFNSLSHPLLVE